MKRYIKPWFLAAVVPLVMLGFSGAFAQCPEDPDDHGECDTLNVICLDCDREETGDPGPWSVRFPLLISNDLPSPVDSIAGFAIPLTLTSSNPSAYCSASTYWNNTQLYSVVPDFERSILRHMFETDYPAHSADTLYRNRMAALEGFFTGRGWDMITLNLADPSNFWLSMVPLGSADQRWWEGQRVLLATMTLRIQDTMHVCVDTTFWPPASRLAFARSDAIMYVPRHNMPTCFWVGPPQAASIAVTAPNGGEQWCVGDAENITWTSTGIDAVKIEYSTNGGSSWTVEAASVPAAGGSYSWTVPDAPSANCLVRICDASDSDPCDQSDAAFTILDSPAAPSGCVASDDLCDRVSFSWTDNSTDETGFNIYRDGSPLASVGANVTSYDDMTATAGTTYEYCVRAYNDCGESGQCCDNGTVLDVPAAPTACSASDDLCDKVSLTWTDNSDNETGFNITRDGSALASVGANVTSYDDLTAAPGVTYSYCVSSYNDCGESSQACDDGIRLAPPAAPSGCVASDDLCDKVSLSWTDNSADESGFNIYRDGSPLGSVGADVTSYDDATAAPGVTYSYCVSSYNDCGESSQACDDGIRLAPPAAPSGCVASDDLCDKVSFTWTDNSADESGFNIYRDGSPLASVGADVTTYDDPTATPGTTYEYCVRAYNDCGESGQCCDNGTRPTENVAVTAPNGGEEWCVGTAHDITWTSDCIDLVDIDYSTDGGSNWLTVAADVSAPSGSYSWTIPDAPSTNCLVRICDASDGDPCDQSDAAFTILDSPAAPTACSASDDLCDKVSFSWTDNSADESGFNITRDGSALASVGANVTTYDDPTATPGVTYSYCVSAYNDCGESSQCCDDGTRRAPPAAPSDCMASDDLCDKVSFTWTDNSADESGFNIYRDGSALATVGADVTSYDDATATPGTTYEYCVRAYNDCGESSQCCDDGTRLAPPAAPSGCLASDDLCDKVSFTWTDNSADESGFNIYRDGSPLASVGANVTTYDDPTAASGVTYSYCVSAYNDCGESGQCCDDGVVVPQAVTVTAPNGGEEWCVGTVNDITWTSGCIDLVDIDYSTDGGSSWLSVAVDVSAASGSYSWTIPNAPSANCLVRICDAEDAAPCDQSDDVFVICTGDFTLDVLEEGRKVLAGNSTDYHVALTSVSGFASPCTLTVSGLPADASASFVPNPVVPTDTSVMTISAAMTTPSGYCTLTVTGTEIGGTAIQHSEDALLTVSWVEALAITARHAPVDVTVTDPAGDYISPDFNGILDAYYEETYDENGQPVDQITISLPLLGRYHIEISRGSGANANDVFDLEAGVSDEQAVILASNVPVPLGGRTLTYDYLCVPWLIGDANGDSKVDLGDVVYLLNYLFRGDSPPEPAPAGDLNSDGSVDLGDVIYLLNYLYRSGPPPGY